MGVDVSIGVSLGTLLGQTNRPTDRQTIAPAIVAQYKQPYWTDGQQAAAREQTPPSLSWLWFLLLAPLGVSHCDRLMLLRAQLSGSLFVVVFG